jgi:hypothetical protein
MTDLIDKDKVGTLKKGRRKKSAASADKVKGGGKSYKWTKEVKMTMASYLRDHYDSYKVLITYYHKLYYI